MFHHIMNKDNKYILLPTFILVLFFPILGLFLMLSIYLCIQPSKQDRKIIYIGIVYAIAFIAYNYLRINGTGDILQYGFSLKKHKLRILQGVPRQIFADAYDARYPVWHILLHIMAKLNLKLAHVNWLAAFCIYGSNLYIIYYLTNIYQEKNADKILIVKFFLFCSFVLVFGSYGNMWAFSWVALGIFQITFLDKKLLGALFILLGIGIHPVGMIPLFALCLSCIFRFKKYYIGIFILIGSILKFSPNISKLFSFSSFLYNKISSYIYGKWSIYRFHNLGEYVYFALILLMIIFISIVLFWELYKKDKREIKEFSNYNNFIAWYFCLALMLVFFRTFGVRLFYDGFLFFIPLFYQVIANREPFNKDFKTKIMYVIWFLMVDIRTFNIFNNAYQIGSGFPSNLFDSPLSFLFK